MKYLLVDFENEHYWLEIGDEGYALRQLIIEADGQYHVSCLEDCLAEGIIDENELDGKVHPITQHEFEIKWSSATTEKRKLWNVFIKKYPIGKEVECKAKYYYPQGWIMDMGLLLGIYQGALNLHPDTLLSGRVIGYDEVNMWVVISIE